jgi:hypothetical protein
MHSRMATLEEINQLAKGVTDFRIQSYSGSKLLLIGSFDLCYYHDIELIFSEVSFIRCPTTFFCPHFTQADTGHGESRFQIHTDEGDFEIVAGSLDATIGKVFHYDRGDQLQPGERIADWVRRAKA